MKRIMAFVVSAAMIVAMPAAALAKEYSGGYRGSTSSYHESFGSSASSGYSGYRGSTK